METSKLLNTRSFLRGAFARSLNGMSTPGSSYHLRRPEVASVCLSSLKCRASSLGREGGSVSLTCYEATSSAPEIGLSCRTPLHGHIGNSTIQNLCVPNGLA